MLYRRSQKNQILLPVIIIIFCLEILVNVNALTPKVLVSVEHVILGYFVSSFEKLKIKTHFHVNGFAISLALKQRPGSTQKWPIIFTFKAFMYVSIRLKNIVLLFSVT